MEWTTAPKIVLTVLLVAVAVLDLKTQRVPHLITWPFLMAAIVAAAWEGSWIPAPLLLCLVLVEVLPQIWQIPAVVVLTGTAQCAARWTLDDPTGQFVALWWGVAYALWVLHVLGGGDTRLFMALVALFPQPGMVAALWGGFALVGVVWLLVLYRHSAPVPLVQAGQDILSSHYPSREELEEHGRPTTPGLALGALVYLWLMA